MTLISLNDISSIAYSFPIAAGPSLKNSTVIFVLFPELITVLISFHSGALVFTGICSPNVALYNILLFSSSILTPKAGFA